MNNRKQHVIKMAHQLFIDKGYHATSIQDIVDYSRISKGTFYNYFSSKSELLIAIFKTLHKNLEEDRNELLIGQNRSDIETFIKQLELQFKTNEENKLFTLVEEVFVSNDVDLKQFIKKAQLMQLNWLYLRFIDIFGEKKKPYLLDCAVMFMGMLHHNFHYQFMAYETSANIHHVIRYSVQRLEKMVNEVSETGDHLFEPELLEKWLPDCQKKNQDFKDKLVNSVFSFKKVMHTTIDNEVERAKHIELLDFIQEEVLESRTPRKFLIESALQSLKENQKGVSNKELQKFEQQIASYIEQSEGTI